MEITFTEPHLPFESNNHTERGQFVDVALLAATHYLLDYLAGPAHQSAHMKCQLIGCSTQVDCQTTPHPAGAWVEFLPHLTLNAFIFGHGHGSHGAPLSSLLLGLRISGNVGQGLLHGHAVFICRPVCIGCLRR